MYVSTGMATPPTSNCDDVSQDSSGTFSFAQSMHSSTKLSGLTNSVAKRIKQNGLQQREGNKLEYYTHMIGNKII